MARHLHDVRSWKDVGTFLWGLTATTCFVRSGATWSQRAYDGSAATGVGGDESNNAATSIGIAYLFFAVRDTAVAWVFSRS
jgi:hypothetical protein